MTAPLETRRLLLGPAELADAEQTQILFPPDGAYRYYREMALPAVERGDAWHWSLRLKTNPDQLIGFISLVKGETTNRGFWIGQQWQGQGLMTEACDAVTD